MLLQFGALGLTMSWDDGFPGARASRPHNEGFPGARASRPHNDGLLGARASRPQQAWHSLGHLPHLDRPATAPWLSFGLADGVLAHRVAACSIALKLSGGQRKAASKGTGCGRDARAPRPPGRGGSYESETRVLKKGARWPEAEKDGEPPQAGETPRTLLAGSRHA